MKYFVLAILSLFNSFVPWTSGWVHAGEDFIEASDRPLIVVLPGAQAELAAQSSSSESLIEIGAGSSEVGDDHYVAVEFQAGMPAGFRLKVMAGGGWVVEASIGGALTSVGSGEVIGVGARKEFMITSDGVKNGLIIAPGADIYIMPGNPNDPAWLFRQPSQTVYFLAANADVMWLHDFAPNFGIELGARLGAALAIDGKAPNGTAAAGTWMPDLGFILGVRL